MILNIACFNCRIKSASGKVRDCEVDSCIQLTYCDFFPFLSSPLSL